MANFNYKMLKNGLRKMTNRTDPNQINNHWEVMKQIRDPQDIPEPATRGHPRGPGSTPPQVTAVSTSGGGGGPPRY